MEVTESLYYAEVKLLTKYCHHCLDKKMKDKIMLFLLKKTLYDNAVELELEDDAEQYLTELFNLLDLRRCDCEPGSCTCKCCNDGYCELS